jgi:hypothetical protein
MDAYTPGIAVGLGADNANIAGEINKTVPRTEADTSLCRGSAAYSLLRPDAAEIAAALESLGFNKIDEQTNLLRQ